MELKECITCGSHNFTDNKCDYCGNKYEANKENWQEELKIAPLSDYMKGLSDNEIKEIYSNLKDGLTPNQIRTATCKDDLVKNQELNKILDSFEDKKGNELAFKIMVWTLLSIIWFAICIFIPPLFLITIFGLIVWVCRIVYKKINKSI